MDLNFIVEWFIFLCILPLHPLVFPAFLIPLLINIHRREYESTQYFKITGLPFSLVKSNPGRYGEYLIYLKLKDFAECDPQFLFNLYIPRGNGETTEADVVMITKRGVFVFESKNYHGWIFGNEKHPFWYQTFENGQKQQFFNPVMQNNLHIKHIKNILHDENIPVWSIIVFSDDCVLKEITMETLDVSVVNREYLYSAVGSYWSYASGINLSEEKIKEIYSKLYPYSQCSQEIREKHIFDIQNNH